MASENRRAPDVQARLLRTWRTAQCEAADGDSAVTDKDLDLDVDVSSVWLSASERRLHALLGLPLHVELSDGRHYRGRCACIDRAHIVLQDAAQIVRSRGQRGDGTEELLAASAPATAPALVAHPTGPFARPSLRPSHCALLPLSLR